MEGSLLVEEKDMSLGPDSVLSSAGTWLLRTQAPAAELCVGAGLWGARNEVLGPGTAQPFPSRTEAVTAALTIIALAICRSL